jgi:hypothetical protein
MAKFFLFNRFGHKDSWTDDLQSASFWENWIDTQSVRRPAERLKSKDLDEHSIWEKAVNLDALGSKS